MNDVEKAVRELLDLANRQRSELATKDAEIERLRDALEVMVYETTHLSPEEDDGSHKCRIRKAALMQARAALEATQ